MGGASRVAGFDRHVEKASTSADLVDAFIRFMGVLNEGMGGMIHQNDIRVAESLRGIELPDDPAEARKAWRTALNDAVVKWHRDNGSDVPDLNEVERSGLESRFCFPHYFLLPQFSSAASYRVRPLGPEETLFEIYSLTRYPPGSEPPRPMPPEPLAPDDPRWPLISAQDFSNLPRQQEGLHSNGFTYMRLSDQMEGMISNLERLVDGYLAGLPDEKLLPAIRKTNTVIDVPIAEFDF
jgi:Ring hydroxylating alpha subunit (catalytic domain)